MDPVINLKTGHAKLVIEIKGKNLAKWRGESGVHRIQRAPVTEKKKDRVHTSSITVAVLSHDEVAQLSKNYSNIPEKDLKVEWYSGTGAGGQHRNKHQNSCRLTHIPTGVVATAQTRSQISSKELALKNLLQELSNRNKSNVQYLLKELKQAQTGSGDRGSLKKRTYRFQDDTVADHETNRKARVSDVLSGKLDLLW